VCRGVCEDDISLPFKGPEELACEVQRNADESHSKKGSPAARHASNTSFPFLRALRMQTSRGGCCLEEEHAEHVLMDVVPISQGSCTSTRKLKQGTERVLLQKCGFVFM